MSSKMTYHVGIYLPTFRRTGTLLSERKLGGGEGVRRCVGVCFEDGVSCTVEVCVRGKSKKV